MFHSAILHGHADGQHGGGQDERQRGATEAQVVGQLFKGH